MSFLGRAGDDGRGESDGGAGGCGLSNGLDRGGLVDGVGSTEGGRGAGGDRAGGVLELDAVGVVVVRIGRVAQAVRPRGVGGQPLAKGRILFMPVAPNQGPVASAAVTDGKYSISQFEGPVVGPNRVEVEAELNLGFAIDDEAAFARRGGRQLPANPIPPQYNRDSQLSVEVKSGDENHFDVTIPSARHAAARPQY